MKNWFKDQHFRSLLKNTSYLAISQIVAAVASLATLAFVGRGIGLALFGTLVLITSYTTAATSLAKFQSWQLVVRYGGQGLTAGDPQQFKVSTGFALALDLLSGIGGMVVAVLLLPLLAPLVGIKSKYLWLAIAYCTRMPTMGGATPNGVLRALDRFDLISWSSTVSPIARVILAGMAFAAHAPFPVYVGIWFVTDFGGDLYIWYLGVRELSRRGLLKGIRPTLKPTALVGAWRFAIHTNLTSSINTVWGPVARLVVGGLLGPTGAALFRIASSLADVAQKPANLLGKAFYPEIVRMDLTSRKPWRLMLRGTAFVSALALVAILILLFAGKPLIMLVFGKREFLGAYAPLMVMMFVPFLGIFSFSLAPMLYAFGRSDAPLAGKIFGSIVFFSTIAPLSWRFGVIGAATAFVLGQATDVATMSFQLLREYRRTRSGPNLKQPV